MCSRGKTARGLSLSVRPPTGVASELAHFIRDLWNQGFLDVQFVRSEDNESDICTKNVTEKILTTFSPHIRNGTLRCWRDWERLNREIVRAIWREDVVIYGLGCRSTEGRRSRLSDTDTDTFPSMLGYDSIGHD
jgi:hypothetical protein